MKMGTSYTILKNVSNEQNNSFGCVSCPLGHKPGNPGTFEDIHRKIDELDPKYFDGLKIKYKRGLSNHFHMAHTFGMKSKFSSILMFPNDFSEDQIFEGYKFGASYTGEKKVGFTERYPILNGEIKSNGDLKANFIHTLGCRLRIKFSALIKNNTYNNCKASAEYRTDDCTLTISLVEPCISKQEGILLIQFLQAITSRITLGAEIACNKSSDLPRGHQTNISSVFRYSTGFQTLSTTIGQAGVRLCYHHKQSQQLQIGVELQSNFITQTHKSKLVYQVDLIQANVIFKGFIDSNLKLGAVFEKKLCPSSNLSLIFSGFLDHAKNNMSVGIGFNIE